jgi:V8-like Glu-specific endopeptidase
MTRFRRHALVTALAACALLGATLPAAAQRAGLQSDVIPYRWQSGMQTEHVVRVEGAQSLRLRFDRAELSPGSVLRLTSLADGARQHLNAATIQQWRYSSAYFNGGAVKVELIAAEGARGDRVSIASVLSSRLGEGTESQCGATDDRVASNADNRARYLQMGCTANLTADGCFITAGHCMDVAGPNDVIEFNVPLSNANTSLNHPPPSDQYVPTAAAQFANGGLGNDWGVFTVFPNTETGLTPLQAQGPGLEFATTLPRRNNIVEITGYGVDSGTANQTQQVSTGPITQASSSTNIIKYRSDTEGGNSGSAVLVGGRIVAIHTNGGCRTNNRGANSGTMIGNTSFQAAYAAVCGAPVAR